MRFALMTEPQQGLAYEELLALARTAESAGFEAFFRSDHFTSFPGQAGLPTTDAWTTLAGLARETRRIGIGVLVSPVTFRSPGLLAKVVTTVDEMSGGRVEVGLGAGWNEREHAEHGLVFPDVPTRFDMLEEQLEILHGLWTEPAGWSFEGTHWHVSGARLSPRPVERPGRRHPNLIVGGEGKPRTARLAACWADEFNVSSAAPDTVRDGFERVMRACEAADRDPDSIVRSVMVGVLVAPTPREAAGRVAALLTMLGRDAGDAKAWLAERRPRWIVGTHDEALEQLARYEAIGAQRIMLQDLLPRDLEMVEELGELLRLPKGPATQ
ncbi:MAG: LLM class F420-dependent oxidoreductase [Candidatus Limnocylindrales bacterium]|jgi:F420-dependent oxidoreductase-like protein